MFFLGVRAEGCGLCPHPCARTPLEPVPPSPHPSARTPKIPKFSRAFGAFPPYKSTFCTPIRPQNSHAPLLQFFCAPPVPLFALKIHMYPSPIFLRAFGARLRNPSGYTPDQSKISGYAPDQPKSLGIPLADSRKVGIPLLGIPLNAKFDVPLAK